MKFPEVQNFQCCQCQNCLILDCATKHPLSTQTLVWSLEATGYPDSLSAHTSLPGVFRGHQCDIGSGQHPDTALTFEVSARRNSRACSHPDAQCFFCQAVPDFSPCQRGFTPAVLPLDAPSPLTGYKWAACRKPLLIPSFPPCKIIPDFLIGQ